MENPAVNPEREHLIPGIEKYSMEKLVFGVICKG
jgi:hypothetical protein